MKHLSDRLEFTVSKPEPISKRVFDVAVASVSLLAVLPVLFLAGLAIKLTSRGPMFYLQPRRGLGGRIFVVCKLRTLRHDRCDLPERGEITAVEDNDERVFAVGRFLRNRGLDEIPQLWNVLRGHMSIVGPRPHAVAHDDLYIANIQGYSARYAVKPGITGLAQINGSRGTIHSLDEARQRLALDVEYIARRSLLFDLLVVLRTLPLLVAPPGEGSAPRANVPVVDLGSIDRQRQRPRNLDRETLAQPTRTALRATD